MKKIRIMVLAVVVALAMTGAGYAAWGTHITDTTTFGMAGWNVVLEQDSDWSYYAGDNVINFVRGNNSYTETPGTAEKAIYQSFTGNGLPIRSAGDNYVYAIQPTPDKFHVDGKTACAFEFRNLHPGTAAITRFEIRNRGTIPAKIEDVTLTITDINNNPVTDPETLAVIEAFKIKPYFAIHHGDGTTQDDTKLMDGTVEYTFSTLPSAIDLALKGNLLNPADSIQTISDELETGEDASAPVFTFTLPSDKLGNAGEGQANVGMNKTFKVVVDFHFVQYNDVTRQ